MGYYEDLVNSKNQNSSAYAEPLPIVSLANVKAANVGKKLSGKTSRATGQPDIFEQLAALPGGQADPGLGLSSLALSSVYADYEGTKDFLTGEVNLDRRAEADARAQVDPTVRQQFSQDQEAIMMDIARGTSSIGEGQYLEGMGSLAGAAYETAKLGPQLAADSAGSLVGGIAGTAMTALGGSGLPVLARTGAKVGKSVLGIKKSYEKAQKAVAAEKKGNRLLDLGKKALKTAGNASIMTAAVMQNMVEDYVRENDEMPSLKWRAFNALPALALESIELGIFKSFLPSKKGIKAMPKEGKLYANEVKDIITGVPGSLTKASARQVFKLAKKVAAASGMEAGQEYLQSWHEILATKMDALTLDELGKEFLDSKSNQDKALFGLFAGAAASGTIKAVTSAPVTSVSLAISTGVSATSGTARLAGKISKGMANKASLKVLNEEERAVLKNEYEIQKTVADQEIIALDDKAERVIKSTTIEELQKNSDLKKHSDKVQNDYGYTDIDLQDKGTFKQFKDRVVREYKADKFKIKAALEASSAARMVKKASQNIQDKTVAAAKELVKDIPVDEVVKTVTKYGAKTVEAVKEIRSSTALGIIEMGVKEGDKQAKILLKAASNLGLNDLKIAAKVISKDHPKLGKQFDKLVELKESGLTTAGQFGKDLINKDTISPVIVDMAEKGIVITKEIASASKILNSTLKNKIADLETLDTIEKAFSAYKKSTVPGTKGAINAVSIKILGKKLTDARTRLTKPSITDKEYYVKAAKDIKEKGLIPYFSDTALVNKLAEVYKSDTAQDLIKKVKEKLPDLPDLNDPITTAKFEKQVEDHFKTIKETIVGPDSTRTAKEAEKGSSIAKFMTVVETGLESDPKGLIANIPALVTKMKKAEYVTADDFNDLANQFPGIKEDKEFFEKFQAEFESEVVMYEDTDNLPGQSATMEEASKLRDELHPECKGK